MIFYFNVPTAHSLVYLLRPYLSLVFINFFFHYFSQFREIFIKQSYFRITVKSTYTVSLCKFITVLKKYFFVLLLLLSRFSRVQLLRPHRRQPTRLPGPWDSPGKNTGVGGGLFLIQSLPGVTPWSLQGTGSPTFTKPNPGERTREKTKFSQTSHH